MIAQTSLFAYNNIKRLGAKQEEVFEAVRELGRATNEEIADHLGWAINRVTGRTNELRRFGYLTVDGTKKSKSGMSAKVLVVTDPQDRKLREILANDCEG